MGKDCVSSCVYASITCVRVCVCTYIFKFDKSTKRLIFDKFLI